MPRILVIDDELEARVLIEKILLSAGHEVALAGDGLDALRQFRAERADLVIADVFMPDVDGLETMIALRREFPGTKIIAISGNIASDPMLSVARRLGAIATLEKPFTREQLVTAVEKAL